MQITRSSSIDTQKGPADWFTGDVYIDALAAPEATSTFAAASVHFTPGARTAWHTHPHGQTIFVTEGVGLCQREGGPIEEIRPGDRVFFEPGENHWHGAAPNRFMVHIAMQQNDETGEGGRACPGASTSPTSSTAAADPHEPHGRLQRPGRRPRRSHSRHLRPA
jgi:quercetin dioxygenase-like cupin family protein